MITGASTVLEKRKTDYGLWRYGILHSHSLRIHLRSLEISRIFDGGRRISYDIEVMMVFIEYRTKGAVL